MIFEHFRTLSPEESLEWPRYDSPVVDYRPNLVFAMFSLGVLAPLKIWSGLSFLEKELEIEAFLEWRLTTSERFKDRFWHLVLLRSRVDSFFSKGWSGR